VTPLYAITIKQPWAWAIAAGHKTVENRTWQTKFRGPIYIHAGGALTSGDNVAQCERLLAQHGIAMPAIATLTRGALIATAELVDCGRFDDPWGEPLGWHFRLANIVALDAPIPVRGALGIWRVSI